MIKKSTRRSWGTQDGKYSSHHGNCVGSRGLIDGWRPAALCWSPIDWSREASGLKSNSTTSDHQRSKRTLDFGTHTRTRLNCGLVLDQKSSSKDQREILLAGVRRLSAGRRDWPKAEHASSHAVCAVTLCQCWQPEPPPCRVVSVPLIIAGCWPSTFGTHGSYLASEAAHHPSLVPTNQTYQVYNLVTTTCPQVLTCTSTLLYNYATLYRMKQTLWATWCHRTELI